MLSQKIRKPNISTIQYELYTQPHLSSKAVIMMLLTHQIIIIKEIVHFTLRRKYFMQNFGNVE
jgi:hypothetical protein